LPSHIFFQSGNPEHPGNGTAMGRLSKGEQIRRNIMTEEDKLLKPSPPPASLFAPIYGECQFCGKERKLYPMINPINMLKAAFFCEDCFEQIYDRYPG
jgi:hypothetical protein